MIGFLTVVPYTQSIVVSIDQLPESIQQLLAKAGIDSSDEIMDLIQNPEKLQELAQCHNFDLGDVEALLANSQAPGLLGREVDSEGESAAD